MLHTQLQRSLAGGTRASSGRRLAARLGSAGRCVRRMGCAGLRSVTEGRAAASPAPLTRRARGAGVACRVVANPDAPAKAPAPPEELSSTWYEEGGVTVWAHKHADGYSVTVEAAQPRQMVLHWAVNDWEIPPLDHVPPGTNQVDDKAVQTPFEHGQRVHMHFPSALAPERIVFVLKELQPENWINNGSCYSVQLKPPSVDKLTGRVLQCEGQAEHWSLKDRFVMACDVLDGLAAAGAEGMAFAFTWLRLSSNKVLTWSRRSNYQSKDITWMQKVISERMTDKARGHPDPWVRLYARLALAGLPRGGGNGDDIRMGILHIMRDGGIKEGHRPGRDEPFLEQWHQKLHQNTTPEDVTICEAYLAFLHSGNHDDYWRVLWDNGRITKERLESMHIPIKAWPQHLPHLINAFKGYLWTLKCAHSGADMDTAAEMAKGSLDGDLAWQVFDTLKNRNEWWVPGKIVDIRRGLANVWRTPGTSRDVLLLDIAFDNYFRTCIERTDRSSLTGDSLIDMIALVLDNASIAAESEELCQCARLWYAVKDRERWSTEWALAALAAVQRIELSLAQYADDMLSHVQPHAEAFGAACAIDPAFITNFGEEVIRGQPVFVLSGLLQDLERHLRAAAGAGVWQVISQVPAMGEVLVAPGLEDMQGTVFERPVAVLAKHLGGMEDIPQGVAAVITQSSTDILSHVAIRARSQGVLLATCYDDAEFGRLAAMQGQHVSLEVSPQGDVVATQVDPATADRPGASSRGLGFRRLTLAPPEPWSCWALGEEGFGPGRVGAKANNLAALRKTLPTWIEVPGSVALPFGCFERALYSEANPGLGERLARLQAELNAAQVGAGVPPALAAARRLVGSEVQAPPELVAELSRVGAAAGLPLAETWAQPGSRTWPPVWKAITQVWASQWAERAWLSRVACGIPEGQLCMSVLLQQVVDGGIGGTYAFVLHTANPLTGRQGDMFGEMVPGLGEVLVGNYPGRALSFSDSPGAPEPKLLSLPSKRVGLYSPPGGTLIARSDTNGEDLEAFAGAGLYDSVPVVPLAQVTLEASAEPLLWDGGLRAKLIDSIVDVGQAVEAAFGGVPQDIEGVWRNTPQGGQITVVQARPQVLPVPANGNGSSA